ncbi:MAG: ThiF family adenylyltransferase [Terriglobia bacterium]
MVVEPAPQIDYSRLAQTVFGCQRLRELSAVVIGAGALGNEVVKSLGMLGIQRMLIIDDGITESSNLTRSFFLRSPAASGRNKALALAHAAAGFFPDTLIRGLDREIAAVGLAEIQPADILFSCVDSDLARLEIASISTRLCRPVCDAGLGTSNYSHGRVSYFPGRDGACFGCCLTRQRRREIFALVDCATQPCWAAAEDTPFPSTPTMSAIIGAMQVELGLRAILDSQPAGAITVELSLDPSLPSGPCGLSRKLDEFRLPQSRACLFHADPGVLIPAPGPPSQTTVQTLLRAAAPYQGDAPHGEPELVLDWPVCARAQCRDCRHSWAPMMRLAQLRKLGACPACGGGEISEQEIIRTVGGNGPWAESTLEALGMPENHLYAIQFDLEGGRAQL